MDWLQPNREASRGFDVVIYPVSAFRGASRAMKDFYGSLARRGDVSEFPPQMMPRSELYDTIKYYDYEALDASIARTVLDGH